MLTAAITILGPEPQLGQGRRSHQVRSIFIPTVMWRYRSIVSSGVQRGSLQRRRSVFLQAKQRATNRPNAEISTPDCFLHLVPGIRLLHNTA